MSVNPPPNPNVSTFNNLYWISANTALTTADGDLRYLKFPVAQGTENLQTTNIQGALTCNSTANFASLTSPTSSATQPASNDSTTKIPTTAWVQTAIGAGGSILATNNIFTGTNAFNNVAPITSSATQPASNDSSTKIPTTAWVQTAIGAGGGSNITPNSIIMTRTNIGTSSTCGITNNYNTGGYFARSITQNSSYGGTNYTAGIPLKIIIANNSGSSIFNVDWDGALVIKLNCWSYTTSLTNNYAQTECKITLYGPCVLSNWGTNGGTLYNINNSINGNTDFTYTDPTYAPYGRQYWTYDQAFSGTLGATQPAFLQGVNGADGAGTYTIYVYFQASVIQNWNYNAQILNANAPFDADMGVYLG